MTLRNYFTFKGVRFLLSGSIKFLDGDYTCEHTHFQGLCIKCIDLLKANWSDLITNGADKPSCVDDETRKTPFDSSNPTTKGVYGVAENIPGDRDCFPSPSFLRNDTKEEKQP